LKSGLSNMSTTAPACFQAPFAWNISFYLFTLSLYLFSSVRFVSCKQQMVVSFNF
jgi:hypothetical protein